MFLVELFLNDHDVTMMVDSFPSEEAAQSAAEKLLGVYYDADRYFVAFLVFEEVD